MPLSQSLIQVDLVSDLKNLPIATDTKILMVGKDSIDDGKGGFYRWEENSVLPEDLTSMAVIQSNVMTNGRWIRVFQKQTALPQGTLVVNGGIKTLFVQTVTDANGEATIYLTMEGTSNGTPIFSEVLKNVSHFRGDAPNISSAVQSYVKVGAITGAYKLTTHGYYKVQAINILLGGIIAPIASVGSNVPVVFEVVGR